MLGFRYISAFENIIKWEKPTRFKGKTGIKNLHFGNVETDIIADEKSCFVRSNAPYTLEICGKAFKIEIGENEFLL